LKLATRRNRTASPPIVKTIGIVEVAVCAARAEATSPVAAIAATPFRGELLREPRQRVVIVVRPAFLDANIAAFDEARLRKPFAKGIRVETIRRRRRAVEKADQRHARRSGGQVCRRSCLRPQFPRACRSRCAERRDEITPPHELPP
jgi:hypothetical protein